MTDLDDLPFSQGEPAPANPAAPGPRKCWRHRWRAIEAMTPTQFMEAQEAKQGGLSSGDEFCLSCWKERDFVASSRGRRNKNRGNRIQRQRIEGLGGRNLAGNNPNLDGLGLMFAYESKSGGAFSERVWRWLVGIPKRGNESGVLIVTEAPGRGGGKARSYVVVEYDEWRALHGEGER